MNMNIWHDLTEVFRNVFEDETIELFEEMTANDIDGWDSLSHSVLMLSIEEHFHINFSQKDILRFNQVGDIQKTIESKLN